MKIGIWLGWDGVRNYGGAFSYSEMLLKVIDEYNFSQEIELCYISLHPQKSLKREVIGISQIPEILLRIFGWSNYISKRLKGLNIRIIKKRGLTKILGPYNIKVIYYIQQWTCIDPNFPFISNNWDIGHLSTYTFPEFIRGKGFENRCVFYSNILPKALMVLCESEAGMRELQRYTIIGDHKLRVMPIFAGEVSLLNVTEDKMSEILRELKLEKYKYLYYPAQFWAHKNHYGVLRAFKDLLQKHGNKYKMVFTGSEQGNMAYINETADSLGISEHVIFLGFVSKEIVYTLYKNAICLIMASHFGPTNMPPIEAMEMGCPVICSDLDGHKEILGDSALYFNSYDYQSIMDAMEVIINQREIYKERIIKQKGISKFNINYAICRLNDILKEVVVIRSNWG